MLKINQIETSIREMEGGRFQKLCDSYLRAKGYANINSLGSVVGSDKVRKGTPDSFIQHDNGKFIFAEYTTQQSHLINKLSSDLDKCLNEEQTGVKPSNIDKVILCHTSRLLPIDEQCLQHKASEQGVKLEIYGIEGISFDLYQKFPGIAKDFLGVSVDTGQIVAPDEFVSNYDRSQYSTPLETEFYFREEEIDQALTHLSSKRVVLISGHAGVGKTRLALEVMQKFKNANPDYEIFCIRDLGLDLSEDLKIYFSRPGRFLFLVDDANRISLFGYIIHLIQNCREDQEIKVVTTVRDYALEKVKDDAYSLVDLEVISIQSFEKVQNTQLLKNSYEITNYIWLDRIWEISKGNPRLAIMAAKLAIEDGGLDSILDASTLYDQYFSSIREDLRELDNPNILKVAGIISLFRSVDKSNEQLMEMISDVFAIDANTFWQATQLLHAFELVDIYENEVVKISDQVLATYLFYLCVFKNKEISLKNIFESFFPIQNSRIRDAIYPCLNSFNFVQLSAQIRSVVYDLWMADYNAGNHDKLRQLIETCWFSLKPEVLPYLYEQVSSMEEESIALGEIIWEPSNRSDTSSLLPLFNSFARMDADDEDYKISLETICQYTEKRPSIIPFVLRTLLNKFGFNRYSHRRKYSREHILVDILIIRTMNGNHLLFSRLFINFCKGFLRTQFQDVESNARVITFHPFTLFCTPELLKLREKIWDHLFLLFGKEDLKEDVLHLFSSYCDSGFGNKVNKIAEHDFRQLAPLFYSTLDSQDFQHCQIVQKYVEVISRKEIDLNVEALSENFNSEVYKIYKLIISDRETEIDEYTRQYNFQEYQELISFLRDIYEKIRNSHIEYPYVAGLWKVFTTLANRTPDLYVKVIGYYLSIGDPFQFRPPTVIVEKLIEGIGLESTVNLINAYDFSTKPHWVFASYQALKEEQIEQKHIDQLYNLYAKAELEELPHNYNYLLKYLRKDSQIIVNITKILLAKSQTDQRFGHSFEMLLSPIADINRQIVSLFEGNETILQQAYLANERVDKHSDYDGSILNLISKDDSQFLLECIDRIYTVNDQQASYDDPRDYRFLWLRDDTETVMEAALIKFLKYKKERGYINEKHLMQLFCVGDNNSTSQEIQEKQIFFLKRVINMYNSDLTMMLLVFSVVRNFEIGGRVQLVANFLSYNSNLQDFKELPLELDHWGWEGSAVPMISGKISFWESLLPLCNSVHLLAHRQYIGERIGDWQNFLAAQKKSDFIRGIE